MAAKHQQERGWGACPALQEKWNLEVLGCDKWDCCLALSCLLIGSEQPAPVSLPLVVPAADSMQLVDGGNCAEFIKPHWSPVIVFISPGPFYLICPYLALQHLFAVPSADSLWSGLHACLMSDRLFNGPRVRAARRCSQH